MATTKPKPSPIELATVGVDLSLERLTELFQGFAQAAMAQIEAETPEKAAEAKANAIALVKDSVETVEQRDQLVEFMMAIEESATRIRRTVQVAEKLARRKEAFVKALQDSIELFMIEQEISEIQGHLHRFKIYKKPDALQIVDEKQIPEEYFRTVPQPDVRELDKEKLIVDLAAGKEISGAFLETGRQRLDVK